MKIISYEKSGFFLGRSIIEGIIIAHEVIHLTRKTRSLCMTIKLYILKAYGMVYRGFLIEVLKKIGFKKGWIN